MAGKRHDEAWAARRTEIIDRSARLFAERGYHGTGVTELCEAVGMGRGTLYYYIDSKENLLSLIHDRVMEKLMAVGQEALEADAPAAERLLQFGQHLLEIVDEYPDHVTVALHEYKALSAEGAEAFRTSRRSAEDVVEQILRQGVDRGEFALEDVRLATLAWLGMHNYSYIWYRNTGPESPERIAEVFGGLFLRGIEPRNGSTPG